MKVEIVLDDRGYGSIHLDGEDISGDCKGVAFVVNHGLVTIKPTVTLYGNGGVNVEEATDTSVIFGDATMLVMTMNGKRYRVVEELKALS